MKKNLIALLCLAVLSVTTGCIDQKLVAEDSSNKSPFIGTYSRVITIDGTKVTYSFSFGTDVVAIWSSEEGEEEIVLAGYYEWTPKTISLTATKGTIREDTSFMYSMSNNNKTLTIKGMKPVLGEDLDGEYTKK